LVTAEVALATVLVASAGLMARTLINLRQIDLGFQPSGIVAIYIRPGWGATPGGPDMALYYQELRQRIERLPGVQAVGAAKGLPLTTFRQCTCRSCVGGISIRQMTSRLETWRS